MIKKNIFILLIFSLFIFSGCVAGTDLSEVNFFNNVNNTLNFNGSIDILGSYLINGSPISFNNITLNGTTITDWSQINGSGGVISYTPVNSSYSYNNSQLIIINDNYVEKAKQTNIIYNDTSGLISQAIINDTISGVTVINYTYTEGLLTGVTYS